VGIGYCYRAYRLVSKLAMDATSATSVHTSPVDDACGSIVRTIAGALDDAIRPGVDAISGTFMASEYTARASAE
jgi:hypothetical protein